MDRRVCAKSILLIMLAFCGSTNAATTQPTTIDLQSPQAAVVSYFQAVQACDADAAKKAAIENPKIDKLIEAGIEEEKARQAYLDAARKKFGAQEVKVPNVLSMLIAEVKSSKVQEHGDTADIGDHGDYPARKIGTEWKFDLVRQNSDPAQLDASIQYLKDSSAAYAKFTATVPEGSWKTFKEMDEARWKDAPAPPPPP
jgi:hypothetical protein